MAEYVAPEWMGTEDRERIARFREALQALWHATRDRWANTEGEHGVLGCRWRTDALTREMQENARRMGEASDTTQA